MRSSRVQTAPAASNYVAEAPAPTASIPELPAVTTGAIPSTPFVTDAWAGVSSPASQEKISTKTPTAVEEVTPMKERERPSPETAVASTPEASQAEPQTKTSKDSWFSVPSNPWNAELEKANRLASTWDSGAPVAAP